MSHNDITGDRIATKQVSDVYRNNYDAIFGKKTTEVFKSSGVSPVEIMGINIREVARTAFPGTDPNVTEQQKVSAIADCLKDLEQGNFEVVENSDCRHCGDTGKITDTEHNVWDCWCPERKVEISIGLLNQAIHHLTEHRNEYGHRGSVELIEKLKVLAK